MMRPLLAGGTAFAAFALALTLTTFSPASCGCFHPSEDLLKAAGYDYEDRSSYAISAAQVQEGLNRNLVGRSLHGLGMPVVLQANWCDSVSESRRFCSVTMTNSRWLSSGFNIELQADANGRLVETRVRRYWSARYLPDE